MSRIRRKPTFCICENKDADQLREADQRLCFRYTDTTIPPLSKSEISSLWPSSVTVKPGLCRTRSETRMLVFSRRGSYVCFILTCLPQSTFHPFSSLNHSQAHAHLECELIVVCSGMRKKKNEPQHENTYSR